MRILITGSRHWTDRDAIDRALRAALMNHWSNQPPTLIHGGCPTGADHLADQLWRHWIHKGAHFLDPEVVQADWDRHGSAAGPIRNGEMVARGADICLAFPIGVSKGTRDCMRRARLAGIPVITP